MKFKNIRVAFTKNFRTSEIIFYGSEFKQSTMSLPSVPVQLFILRARYLFVINPDYKKLFRNILPIYSVNKYNFGH